MSETKTEAENAFWEYWHSESRLVVNPTVPDLESENYWRVGRRTDWEGAKKPYFLYGGPGGVYSRHNKTEVGENGQPNWFKRDERAQRAADEFNAALRGLTAPSRPTIPRPSVIVKSELNLDKPPQVCAEHFIEFASNGICPFC